MMIFMPLHPVKIPGMLGNENFVKRKFPVASPFKNGECIKGNFKANMGQKMGHEY